MAADRSSALADVARTASTTALADIDHQILMLQGKLADRPGDHRPLIDQLSEALDRVAARQRLLADVTSSPDASLRDAERRRAALHKQLARTRATIEEQLQVALHGQRQIEEWEAEHEPDLIRLAVLSATRHAISHQKQIARNAEPPRHPASVEVAD
jgi:hypothetical protein